MPEPKKPGEIELWKLLGRREAFGQIAGRCSAAEIESIRRIRENQLHESLACSWEQFCERHLRISRRKVDQDISYLERYGPEFFTLRQLTRVTVREYKEIAGQVSPEGLRLDGTVIPLLAEHSEQLAGAVATLVERSERTAQILPLGFNATLQKFRAAAQSLAGYDGELKPDELLHLADELTAMLRSAAKHGLVVRG